jgi:hypothetical protein
MGDVRLCGALITPAINYRIQPGEEMQKEGCVVQMQGGSRTNMMGSQYFWGGLLNINLCGAVHNRKKAGIKCLERWNERRRLGGHLINYM